MPCWNELYNPLNHVKMKMEDKNITNNPDKQLRLSQFCIYYLLLVAALSDCVCSVFLFLRQRVGTVDGTGQGGAGWDGTGLGGAGLEVTVMAAMIALRQLLVSCCWRHNLVTARVIPFTATTRSLTCRLSRLISLMWVAICCTSKEICCSAFVWPLCSIKSILSRSSMCAGAEGRDEVSLDAAVAPTFEDVLAKGEQWNVCL